MDSQVLTPAAQVLVSLIPIVGIVFGAVIVFFALLWRHREAKLKIQSGSYTNHRFKAGPFCLLSSLVLMGVGLVLFAMFFLIEGLSYMLLGGLIPFAVGLGLFIFYKLNPFNDLAEDDD